MIFIGGQSFRKRLSQLLGIALGTCSTLTLLTAFNPAQVAQPGPHRGLKLNQTTEASGVYDVWVSADAIRRCSRSNDNYIAAQAPTWQIQVWRLDRNQFAKISNCRVTHLTLSI